MNWSSNTELFINSNIEGQGERQSGGECDSVQSVCAHIHKGQGEGQSACVWKTSNS